VLQKNFNDKTDTICHYSRTPIKNGLLYSIYSLYRGEYSITGYSILHMLQICCGDNR